ncbi:tetratricopeptide repeat protein [Marinibaculum pumilum]|uniref:protein O-GlcNAc transferase n=1 Tax=Marinibaculum pumilum TaxID=1766165 RepID=A0ABV7KY52_9PROT
MPAWQAGFPGSGMVTNLPLILPPLFRERRMPPSIVDLVRSARAEQAAGRLAEAARMLERCRKIDAEDFNYLIAQADLLRELGRIDEALDLYRRLLGRAPRVAALFDNCALMLVQAGRYGQAEAVLQEGIRQNPDAASLLRNLGILYADLGRPDQGVGLVRDATALAPRDATLRLDLGNVLVRMRQYAEAEKEFRIADELRPNDPGILNNIGGALRHQRKIAAAEEVFRSALQRHPEDPDLNNNLAGLLRVQGRIGEAKELYRRALALRTPWPQVHSNYIFCLDFDEEAGLEEQAAARREWHELNEAPHLALAPPLQRVRDPDKKVLRIGYMSGDFNFHSASDGFGSVLLHHDRSRFHVTLYSNSDHEDSRTEEFIKVADRYVRARMMSDDRLAALIRQDEIDVLVDLSGHSAGNRLPVFARRPAPVQATGWGYATSTGLQAMDYLLADRWLVPWESDRFYTEEIAVLPCVLSFRVPERLPALSPPPCVDKGFVTFGNFNRIVKASPSCLEAWARILQRVPGSRLLLKCMTFDDAEVRRSVLDRLVGFGAAEDQVVLRGSSSRAEQLQMHAEVDIALDSFRNNGGVTTCEALAMGVPVVTLCGDVPVSRNGASIMAGLGCPEWIAHDIADYVEKVCGLAADPSRLVDIRKGLRQLLLSSPLGNNRRYTREVEAAYRRMWIRYCMGMRGAGTARKAV